MPYCLHTRAFLPPSNISEGACWARLPTSHTCLPVRASPRCFPSLLNSSLKMADGMAWHVRQVLTVAVRECLNSLPPSNFLHPSQAGMAWCPARLSIMCLITGTLPTSTCTTTTKTQWRQTDFWQQLGQAGLPSSLTCSSLPWAWPAGGWGTD